MKTDAALIADLHAIGVPAGPIEGFCEHDTPTGSDPLESARYGTAIGLALRSIYPDRALPLRGQGNPSCELSSEYKRRLFTALEVADELGFPGTYLWVRNGLER